MVLNMLFKDIGCHLNSIYFLNMVSCQDERSRPQLWVHLEQVNASQVSELQ